MADPDFSPNLLPAAVNWGFGSGRWLFIPEVQQPDYDQGYEFTFRSLYEGVIARTYLEAMIGSFEKLDHVRPPPTHAVLARGRRQPGERSCTVMGSPPGAAMPALVHVVETARNTPEHAHKLKTEIEELKGDPRFQAFWNVHSPFDLARNMYSFLMPVLAKQNWDYHGATTCRALIEMAGAIVHTHAAKEFMKPECQANWLIAEEIEGSPRGHPLNVYLRYMVADPNTMTLAKLREMAWVLEQTFTNVGEQEQMPTRSTSADAVGALHGAQIVTAECKSDHDQAFEGEGNQCVVMCDTLAWTPLDTALAVHSDAVCFRVTTLQYDKTSDDSQKVDRTIWKSNKFDLTHRSPEPQGVMLPRLFVPKQDPTDAAYVADGQDDGPRLSIPANKRLLDLHPSYVAIFNRLKPRHRAFIRGLFSTMYHLADGLHTMNLWDPKVREAIQNCVIQTWWNETEIPHFIGDPPPIPDEIQTELYFNGFFYHKYGARQREDPPRWGVVPIQRAIAIAARPGDGSQPPDGGATPPDAGAPT